MPDDSIRLNKKQMSFLMSRFGTKDPDEAVELLIEYLVRQNLDPMNMENHINRMMARENN